jgi:hypothetical protein
MGTYPSFAFTPNDTAVVIWAAGQIFYVPLTANSRGEKVASSESLAPIRFTARIEKRLAETRKGGVNVVGFETQDSQRVRAFKELRVHSEGKKVVFQAAGVTYWQEVGKKAAQKVPVTDPDAPYYSPSFVPGVEDIVIHARWSDSVYTKIELADLRAQVAVEVQGLPFGRYFSPVICRCDSQTRTIAFLKTGGSYLSGNILATAGAGLYLGDITLNISELVPNITVSITNIRFVPSEIDVEDRVNMRFLETNKKLLVQQSNRAFVIDFSAKPNKLGKYPHTTLASGEMSTELVISPSLVKKGEFVAENIAFVDFFHVYLAPGDRVKEGETVWSRPANATKGLVRLSLDGGHDVTWTDDGKKLFWFLGVSLLSPKISVILY